MVLQIFLCFLANTTFAGDTTPLLQRKHEVSFNQIVSASDLLEQVKSLEQLNQEKVKIEKHLNLLFGTIGLDEKKEAKLRENLIINKHEVNQELSKKEAKLNQSIFNYVYNDSEKKAEVKAKIFNKLNKEVELYTTSIIDIQESCCCVCYFWSGRSRRKKTSDNIDQSQLVIQKALYALELSGENI